MTVHPFHSSSSSPLRASSGRARVIGTAVGAVFAAACLTMAAGGVAHADALPVPEGTAADFAVLAGSTITNTNATTIVGDIGVHPGDAVVGYDDGADAIIHTGALHVADGVALGAKNDATVAYDSAAGQGVDATFPTPELGGMTLVRGVYDSETGTFENSGVLTLDAEGDPSAIFVFQMESTLITSPGSSMVLLNGANSCNVYWVVGSSATLGGGSSAVGTIMADQTITMGSGSQLQGRAWASVAAVNLDNNVIDSTCVLGDDDGNGNGNGNGDGGTNGNRDDGTNGTDDDATGGTGGTNGGTGDGSQIPTAPTGGVATGDGSSLVTGATAAWAVGAALLITATGATATGWRRRTA